MSEEHEPRSAPRARMAGQDNTPTSSVSAKTQEAADQVKHVARERVEQVRRSAETVKTQAAERVRKFGSAVRWVGESLRHEDEAFVARYADTASDRIDRLATYIDSAEPAEMMNDFHDLARQKPAWFFGGALLLGLGAGRFLKSSAPAVSSVANEVRRTERPRDERQRTTSASSRDGASGTRATPRDNESRQPQRSARHERNGGASS
jgi:hypothetical protein